MKATIDNKGAMADSADHPPPTVLRAESQSLRVLRWRPSADRSPPQDREGPCRSVGGPVPGARRSSPAPRSEPASIPSSPFVLGFPPLAGEMSEGQRGPRGMPSQGPGDRTWSRRTSTPAHHRREATAREDPARVNRRKAAYSERCPQAPRRGPSPWPGDMGRVWIRKLAV